VNPSQTNSDAEPLTVCSRSSVSRLVTLRVAHTFLVIITLLMVSDFVIRGIVPAFQPAKTDFSEVYTGSWLWRHGQNFYNSALVTATQLQLVGVSVRVAPIYPPTTFALLSPFTFLPWGWANFLWLSLGFAGIAATILLLLHLRGSRSCNLTTLALITFLLSFDPLHQAFHLGNVVLLVVPLALCAIFLAENRRDWWAGIIIGFVICLKPQIGVWVLLYYLLRRRWLVVSGAFACGISIAATLLLQRVSLINSIPDYRANLHYWFAPGRPYGFTEGALPFHVNIIQVLLYRWFHSVLVSNLVAHALFASGVAVWILLLLHTSFRIPAALAISSILALGFLSLYHSVSDATILTLALCWALPAKSESWTRAKVATCIIFLLMMLPGHSLLMRLSPHIAPSITTIWWWNLFVARYFVWLLLGLNIALLLGMWECAHSISMPPKIKVDKGFPSGAALRPSTMGNVVWAISIKVLFS
jgi:Glycosyltransferase family 87